MLKRLAHVLFIMLLFIFQVTHVVWSTPSELSPSFHFMTLTDIHFDPFIYCQQISTKPCPLITKLQEAAVKEWPTILQQYEAQPSTYRQDSNAFLMTSVLTAAHQITLQQHMRFIMILGDTMGHELRKKYKKYSQNSAQIGYKAFAKKVFMYVTQQVQDTFPGVPIYWALGNNDTYKWDYAIDINGAFLNDAAHAFSDAMPTQFKYAGYYAVQLKGQPAIKLIMLNSVLFSTYIKNPMMVAAATQQIQWLHQELLQAKKSKQRVFIAMHIPSGFEITTAQIRLFSLMNLWKPKYITAFNQEIEMFGSQIAGVFSGHLHRDWSYTYHTEQGSAIPVSGTVSVSPIFGNDPGFKVYEYQGSEFKRAVPYVIPLHRMMTCHANPNQCFTK